MIKRHNFSLTFLTSSILTATLLASNAAVAKEEEHREHGAHEHGHAKLNVIVENNLLILNIESPSINVFGFEHQPNNHEQTTIAEDAIKDLKNFASLITLDASAECKVDKTDVDHPFELRHDNHPHDDHKDEHKHDEHKHDEHKDDHADHKDEHKHDEHKEDHADHKDEHKHDEHKEDHADHKDEHKDTHSDVYIEAAYNCEHGEKLTKMDLSPLFKRFPLFVELDAKAIINGKQSASELSKGQPVLSLKK